MEILEQKFGLLAFKVRMDLASSRPQVACALLRGNEQNLGVETLLEWTCETESLGLPRRFDTSKALNEEAEFRLPQYMLYDLKAALSDLNPEGRPLWLHIARPNGILGLLPWERLLQPELGIPILRLPDFLKRPGRDTSANLRIALCVSSPTAKEGFSVASYVSRFCEAISMRGRGGTKIDVFTDSESTADARYLIAKQLHYETQVTVHDPKKIQSYDPFEYTTRVRGAGGRVENPWLLWMTDALSGQTVDMVHIIGHGFLSGIEGSVAFAESPLDNHDLGAASIVDAAELGTFLNRIGAWSVAFSSPERNYSEMGLRQLADKLGQMRPGPVLHHEVEGDDQLVGLSSTYQFLFDGSREPPAQPGLFLYCHPAYLESTPYWQHEEPLTPPVAILDDLENPEQWISATDRYLEQRSLESMRAVAAAQNRGSQASTRARVKEAAETEDTVNLMRKLMEKVAAEQKGRAK